jgi:hypothetical protein
MRGPGRPSAVVLLVMLTSGCTVPAVGWAGIGVDSTGRPIGYLRVCDKHLDGATVYRDGSEDERGRWQAGTAVTDVAAWPLTGTAPGWTTQTAFRPPDAGETYLLYGWTTDNSSSAVDVSFTRDDLAALDPGQVRFPSADDPDTMVVGTEAEFRSREC